MGVGISSENFKKKLLIKDNVLLVFSAFFILSRLVSITRTTDFNEWILLSLGLVALFATNLVPLFLVLSIYSIWTQLPDVKDHSLLTFYATIPLLASLLLVGIYRLFPAKKISTEMWFSWIKTRFFSYLRVLVLLLYFFSFFHKLNSEFFNSEKSCAVSVFNSLLEIFSVPKNISGDRFAQVIIWVTLAAEGGLPFLLLFRRTYKYGLALIFIFHTILSVNFLRFSATMLTLNIAFIPLQVLERIAADKKVRIVIFFSGGLSLISFLQATMMGAGSGGATEFWKVVQLFSFTLLSLFFWVSCLKELFQVSNESLQTMHKTLFTWTLVPKWCWPLLIFIFVSGFSPYLGLKTRGVFSIYSNLRVDDISSNHLIFGTGFPHYFSYQGDVAFIKEVKILFPNRRKLNGEQIKIPDTLYEWETQNNFQVPIIELRRLAQKIKDRDISGILVTYTYKGKVFEMSDIAADPLLVEPKLNIFEKFFIFRFLSETNYCGRLG